VSEREAPKGSHSTARAPATSLLTRREARTPHSARVRIRYRIDLLFARGTGIVVAWLAVIMLAIVLVAAIILTAAEVSLNELGDSSFIEAFWSSLLRTLDPGTMASDEGWQYRVISLLVTLSGILVISSLVGVIVAGVDQRLARLRRGRSEVVERRHTLLLGWSPKVPTLVRELVEANASEPSACIVVMADRDVVDMEEELRGRVADFETTRLVCRRGNPFDPDDLRIASPADARSVVVLRPEERTGDAQVVRGVLAVMSQPGTGGVPIIAELSDMRLARSLEEATGGRVRSVVSLQIIARLAVKACLSRGIGRVHEHLLGFLGNDVYTHEERAAVGLTFGEVMRGFRTARPIGILSADHELTLAPERATRLHAGDRIVLIAEDDSTIGDFRVTQPARRVAAYARSRSRAPEHTLILGWSDLGPLVLEELDHCSVPGSSALVAVIPDLVNPEGIHAATTLMNLSIETRAIDPHDPQRLAELIGSHRLDHVLLLCYRGTLNPGEADALNLMTLLELEPVLDSWPGAKPSIVTEFLDERDVYLAPHTRTQDFIVSERLTALLMSQVSEMPELLDVWGELLRVGGAEITTVPVAEYGLEAGTYTVGELVDVTLACNDALIGYQTTGGELSICPALDDTVVLGTEDELIVVTR
jgi:ion channel POLLUX/CASTOR